MLTKKSPTTKDDTKENGRNPKKTQPSFLAENTPVISPTKENEGRKLATRIIVKYDVGFNNHLFIRGKGANLSWNKGIQLKNSGPDEWIWETDQAFSSLEFKILINDEQYENGDNHLLRQGQIADFTPNFS